MNVSSRLATGRVLAIILAITLVGFGVNAIQLTAQTNLCCQPPAPVVQVQPEPACCPVDPKEIHKAEKEAAHAAHEAEEDAARALKEAEHAQHEAAEDCERNQKKLAHAQHELEEDQARVSELSICPAATCTVAEAPVAEVIIERAKPEPEVEVFVEPAPAPLPEPAPIVTPAPEPPKELPKTASSMDLLGLIGLLSAAGYTTRFFRR